IKYSPAQESVLRVMHIRANGRTLALRLDLDAQGNMYLNGTTLAPDFPLVNPVGSRTVSLYTPWIMKISADGATMVYSTLVQAGGDAIRGFAVDAAGNAYITGMVNNSNGFSWAGSQTIPDVGAYIAKLSPTGTPLFAKSYGWCVPMTAALDETGFYVVGGANSLTFPATTPLPQKPTGERTALFATKFSLDGEKVIYATVFGGSSFNTANSAAVDSQGSLTIGGFTQSPDFPVVNAVQ